MCRRSAFVVHVALSYARPDLSLAPSDVVEYASESGVSARAKVGEGSGVELSLVVSSEDGSSAVCSGEVYDVSVMASWAERVSDEVAVSDSGEYSG